jgi:NADPH-dependent 2,4-dienoyl-CoA reductase/sulfur reductase-like enzyme
MTVTHPCGFLPTIPNVYLAEAFKNSGRIHIPVVTIGGIQDLDEAEKIIADGRADIVSVARGFIADTELVNKAYEGRNDDVTPCIKCMRCHDSTVFGHKYLCAVNPAIGMEHALFSMITPPCTKKKVAVIGGGPAGMKAALTAAERGHDVTLYEKSGSLGGALKFADHVSFKYPLKKFKDFLVHQVEKSAIRVKLNTEGTPDMLKNERYDEIIVAVGAEPVIPAITGIKGKNVVLATDIFGNEKELGNKIVVIGGGQVGCETALQLAREGKNVTIIEQLPELAPDASITHRTEILLELNRERRLTYFTSATCTKVSDRSITYMVESDATEMEADSIIIAVGMKTRFSEAETFIGAAGKFTVIGDCVRAGTVENAIKDAFYAAVMI